MPGFPEYGSLTAEDYAAMGLMGGLEVHRQLATRRKLFCRCPAHRRSDEYHAEVLRHMRPTLSEMGEYDGTALMEFKTRKEIVYRIHRDLVCTYELDDAPPFELNDEALDYAVEICLLFGCSIVGEVHIARKQYLDGSIPTGFQRTAIIGLDGEIPCCGRTVRIQQISLEEDACREVSDVGHVRTYLTDRLSIPLVEVVTKPDLRTPEEFAEAARAIRRACRASGRVATGAGTARQDVNVSVRGGTRIEIKGVPSIRRIPRLVHYEALRQRALLEIRDRLRAAGVDDVPARVADVTRQGGAVAWLPIRRALLAGGALHAVRLPAPFAEALDARVAPNRRLVEEVGAQVRVVACLQGTPNLLHHPSADSPLPAGTWAKLRAAAGAAEDEVLVVVWGPPEDVRTATGEIVDRCRAALEGVPPETRKALEDGTTTFERVLPGPDRMYPDTDLPPVELPEERVEAARRRIPPPPWAQLEALAERGLLREHAEIVVMEGLYDLALAAVDEAGLDGRTAGQVLGPLARRLARAGLLGREGLRALPRDALLLALRRVAEGRLSRDALPVALRQLAGHRRAEDPDDPEALLDLLAPPGDDEVEAAVEAAMEEEPRSRRPEARARFWTGRAMARLRRRAPGAAVAARVRARMEVQG